MATLVRKRSGENKSPLLGQALQRVALVSKERQDVIATQILDTLDQQENPASARYHELIEKKYTVGLTGGDVAELAALEAAFVMEDEAFYAPIMARVAKLANVEAPVLVPPARKRAERRTLKR